MLLLIALTLKGAIAISPTPPPPTPTTNGGGMGRADYSHISYEKENKDRLEKILIEDSEIIKIVELTLKHFII